MRQMHQSLQNSHPERWEVPVMLMASALLLVCGLILPAVTLKELIFWKHTFSVLTGIQNLYLEGHHLLGTIIVLFSVLFPLFKLGVLFVVWFKKLSQDKRSLFLHWLGLLGKWSMLDVFVVAMMIVITKISKFAKAEPEAGIYLFAVSIALAMITTERMEKLIQMEKPATEETSPRRDLDDIFQNN